MGEWSTELVREGRVARLTTALFLSTIAARRVDARPMDIWPPEAYPDIARRVGVKPGSHRS